MQTRAAAAARPGPAAARCNVARHQLDAGVARAASVARPTAAGQCAPRPASSQAASRLASRPWPQPMSSTRACGGDGAAFEQARNTGSRPSLPRAKCQANAAAAAVAVAGQRGADCAPRGMRATSAAARVGHREACSSCALIARRSLGARRHRGAQRGGRAGPSRAQCASSRGSTSSTTGCPPGCGAHGRRAAAGCRRRASRASAAPSTRCGSAVTVSKPRRVQLTRCRPEAVQHRVEERVAQPGRRAKTMRALAA